MGKRVLKAELSVKSIENLKKELLDYKNNELNRLLVRFTEELLKIGIQVVDERMNNASYKFDKNNVMSGADPSHNTFVRISKFGSNVKATLVVTGRELLFIEFGAGVSFNTEKGSSPHKKGEEFGFTIGSYGKGYGSRKVWGYYNDNGDLVLTRGVKAEMPMYYADIAMIQSVVEVARRVFN
jgi:hypothetical protein